MRRYKRILMTGAVLLAAIGCGEGSLTTATDAVSDAQHTDMQPADMQPADMRHGMHWADQGTPGDEPDAGERFDTGVPSDGSVAVDSGPALDSGVDPIDAGPMNDAGDPPVDAAPPPPPPPPPPPEPEPEPGCPPGHELVGDACLPSCGGAGGNTCLGAGSPETLCEGLPNRASYDCPICCARPEHPPVEPASFQFVHRDAGEFGDAIVGLGQAHSNVYFVSQRQPAFAPANQWAAYLSYRHDPQPTAADINRLLVNNSARVVMLEELHNDASAQFMRNIAIEMNTRYPQWRGRWGVFVGFGRYPVWGDAINALLDAGAIFSLQLYPRQSEYCRAGANGGQRDIWLSEQFSGNAAFGRLNWLMARRAGRNSDSRITPLFGVGDVLLDGPNGAKFVDRMFYVWVTRTQYPSLIHSPNGGAGAYKWQDVADTPLRYGVGSRARDAQFAASFQHYAVDRARNSRLGPVDCP